MNDDELFARFLPAALQYFEESSATGHLVDRVEKAALVADYMLVAYRERYPRRKPDALD